MDSFGLDLKELLAQIGLLGVFAIIFIESGLLVGFFLPGDSLLFAAGLLASQSVFNIWALLIGGTIAAIAGDNVGYHLGRKYGSRIFNRPNSLFFNQKHLQRAKNFYATYGPITVILARFMPFIRTFAPVLAGVGQMAYRKFFFYNIFGGFLWVFGLGLLGFYLGSTVPDIDRFVLPIIGAIVVISTLPGLVAIIRRRRSTD